MSGAGESSGRRIARLLLATFYAAAGIIHLTNPAPFVGVTPAWVPHPAEVVMATGLCELAGAIGLLTLRWRKAAGWGLALYAVCVYPANIQHAVHDLGGGTGLGWWYHAPRLFLQPLILWWALWASAAVSPPGGRADR